DRADQLRDLRARILVVGVGVDDHVGANLERGVHSGLEGGGEALRAGQANEVVDAVRACDLGGAIGGAVVHDQPLDLGEALDRAGEPPQHVGQRRLLVQARDLDHQLHGRVMLRRRALVHREGPRYTRASVGGPSRPKGAHADAFERIRGTDLRSFRAGPARRHARGGLRAGAHAGRLAGSGRDRGNRLRTPAQDLAFRRRRPGGRAGRRARKRPGASAAGGRRGRERERLGPGGRPRSHRCRRIAGRGLQSSGLEGGEHAVRRGVDFGLRHGFRRQRRHALDHVRERGERFHLRVGARPGHRSRPRLHAAQHRRASRAGAGQVRERARAGQGQPADADNAVVRRRFAAAVPGRRRSEAAREIGRRIERPPAHWSLLGTVLAGLLLLLAANGLTSSAGHSATATASPGRPALESRAPIWRATPRGLRPVRAADRGRVALTFDDGPDPRWTPRIAAVLMRHRVPATFFEVGEHVVRYPGLADQLRRDGFSLGNHTFTHADLATVPGFERDLEVSLTDGAISGAAGVRPRFFRPPYSATPRSLDAASLNAVASSVPPGELIALTSLDSEDWRRPGVSRIVRNATPRGRRGGVILFHDGGGNRAQTVAALKRLIPRLRARGFRFVSLARLIGLPASAADPKATASQHLRGELLIRALAFARWVTGALLLLLFPIAVLAVLRGIVVAAFA